MHRRAVADVHCRFDGKRNFLLKGLPLARVQVKLREGDLDLALRLVSAPFAIRGDRHVWMRIFRDRPGHLAIHAPGESVLEGAAARVESLLLGAGIYVILHLVLYGFPCLIARLQIERNLRICIR